jgi:putative membrane protein
MNEQRDPRIYFAAERTLLAWIRTALAMMGFGFVVARFGHFLRELATTRGDTVTTGGGSLWAGIALVLLGAVVNVRAAAAHRRFIVRFRRAESEPLDSQFSVAVASVLAVVGFAMALYLLSRR